MGMSTDLFSTAAAAAYVRVSTQALGARRAAKQYQRAEVGGKLFYERAWLDAWKAELVARAVKMLGTGGAT